MVEMAGSDCIKGPSITTFLSTIGRARLKEAEELHPHNRFTVVWYNWFSKQSPTVWPKGLLIGYFLGMNFCAIIFNEMGIIRARNWCAILANSALFLTAITGLFAVWMKNRVIKKRAAFLGVSVYDYNEIVKHLN